MYLGRIDVRDICCVLSETSFNIPSKVCIFCGKKGYNEYCNYILFCIIFYFLLLLLQSKLISVAAIFITDASMNGEWDISNIKGGYQKRGI